MSPRWALAQLLMPQADPTQFSLVADLIEARELGAFVVLGAPTSEQLQIPPRTDDGGVAVLVGSDEEGGRVQNLGHLLGGLPSARAQADLTVDDVRALFTDYGRGLLELGVGMALAPVVDVGSGPGIGDRSFSDDPDAVSRYAAAVVEGYQDAGVIPVIKHFPGHGAASRDTHLGFATTASLEDLRARDLLPFEALLDRGVVVLVGHLIVPGLTEDLPASLSDAAINGLLRDELGFEGVVIIDGLAMNAISDRWTNDEAALLAIAAGSDLVILDGPEQVPAVLDRLERALVEGDLDWSQVQASVKRVLNLKGADPCALSLE